MKIWTWGEVKEKVYDDLDLHDEDFITETEILGYGNSALKDAHKIYIKQYESGLETEEAFPLVSGTATYDLPDDIFETKVTLMQYDDGSRKYVIRELKDKKKIPYILENDDYMYRIINSTASGPQIKLYPTPNETSANNITIHYMRDVREITLDADTMDLPAAADFIIQHVKDSCRNKEAGTLYSAPPSPALQKQEETLIEVLSDMTPDADNVIEGDYSFYEDFDADTGVF